MGICNLFRPKVIAQRVVAAVKRCFALMMVAVAVVIATARDLWAQTAGSTFPDLAEPISITEVGTKVVAFLAVGLGVVVAIKIGLVLMRKLLGWFGKGV